MGGAKDMKLDHFIPKPIDATPATDRASRLDMLKAKMAHIAAMMQAHPPTDDSKPRTRKRNG
jgi:hypothetical protein